ncbi:hypothetical protein LSH36_211g03008 [Paralvinella palmiformis]|uniref:WD repeat domain-containing protein 83 n=1 Tax=Paralvinella palmiformis TaxID=53620 RepID=A0AAD9JPG1_9ANNE|nr:hypothetical protein LSH36_211g03008 [Paralvinella palmiformis]
MSNEIVDKLERSFDCKQKAVRAVRFNADGNYCLTAGSDKSVKLWSVQTAVLLKTYIGHGAEVLDVEGSFDNSLICSCGLDKSVAVLDVASGQIVRKYRGHAGAVNCVQFNEEATVVLSGSLDGTVRIWDIKARKPDPFQVLDEAKDSVTSLKVLTHELLVGSADGRVRRYDIRMGKLFSDYIGKSVTSVSFTRDGQCFLVSTLDSTLKLIDKNTGEMLNEYTGHSNKEYKIDSCISSSDRQILSGSEDGFVYIWDLIDGKILGKLLHKSDGVVHSLSYHPTKCCLVTACENKVYIWMPS